MGLLCCRGRGQCPRVNFFQGNISTILYIYSFISDNYYSLLNGDFNTAMSNKDRKSGNIDSSKYQLEKCVKQLCLNTIWKNQNQNLIEYTWESNANSNMKSRIDYIFVSKNLVPLTKCCDIIPAPVSGHKSVLLNITKKNVVPTFRN